MMTVFSLAHVRSFGLPALLLGAVLASGCGQGKAPADKPKPQVVVTTPISYRVTDYQDFVGRLTAIKTVEIRARVQGFVDAVKFKEGDFVHKGDLLFQIDPRTYRADLNQAKANVNLARADAKLQQKIAARAEDLYSRKAMSREDYDTCIATYEKARASVKAMEAAQARAQLYVNYTRVIAPLDGRISYRNVDPGNLIIADSTLLTTIVTEDPLYCYFDVDERTYEELSESDYRGQTTWFSKLGFPVLMRLATEDDFAQIGTADFIDNRVSANTGTIRMRAVFKNTKGFLKSGLFARIRLPVGMPYDALLIPDEALQSDQGRKYIYVVNDENKVGYRRVEFGQAIKGLRVIKKGLKKGERVIISGMQRVRPKVVVQTTLKDPPKRPHSPVQKLLAFQDSNHVKPVAKQTGRQLHKGVRKKRGPTPDPFSSERTKPTPRKGSTRVMQSGG
jgi:RND family efflux transporter MFP subunit